VTVKAAPLQPGALGGSNVREASQFTPHGAGQNAQREKPPGREPVPEPNPEQRVNAPRPRFARDEKVDAALAAWQAWGGGHSEPDPFKEAEEKYGGPPSRHGKPAAPARREPKRVTAPATSGMVAPAMVPQGAPWAVNNPGDVQTLKLPNKSPGVAGPRFKRDAAVDEALSAWKAIGSDPNEADPFEEAARKYGDPVPKPKPKVAPACRPESQAKSPAYMTQASPAGSTSDVSSTSNGAVRWKRDAKVDEALQAWKTLGDTNEPDPFEELERRNRF
jgi:hypothetical protein